MHLHDYFTALPWPEVPHSVLCKATADAPEAFSMLTGYSIVSESICRQNVDFAPQRSRKQPFVSSPSSQALLKPSPASSHHLPAVCTSERSQAQPAPVLLTHAHSAKFAELTTHGNALECSPASFHQVPVVHTSGRSQALPGPVLLSRALSTDRENVVHASVPGSALAPDCTSREGRGHGNVGQAVSVLST